MLTRFSPFLLIGGFVLVCALMLWPSAVENDAQSAMDQAKDNLQLVVNAARTAQQRHIQLTRTDIIRLVDHMDWKSGSVSYAPRVTGLLGTKYWAVIVTADVKPGLGQALAGPPILPQFYVRSWDLNPGVRSFVFNDPPVSNERL